MKTNSAGAWGIGHVFPELLDGISITAGNFEVLRDLDLGLSTEGDQPVSDAFTKDHRAV
jgi:hypothetical protein